MPIAPENRHRYPANWADEIRPAILERARLRCECRGECGVDHGDRCPEIHNRSSVLSRRQHLIWLTIGHINHVPEDCRPENLRAWCQGCHLRHDGAHHQQTAIQRHQRALEQAGQLWLDATSHLRGGGEGARGGDDPSPPRPASPRRQPVMPSGGRVRLHSIDALPADVRGGLLEAAEALYLAEAACEEARVALGAHAQRARAHGAVVVELIAAAGLTKPRLYRLLEASQLRAAAARA